MHKRPWLAAVLAIVVPGLGHVYLRSWLRALLWFWMVVLSVVIFVPEDLVAGADSLRDALALSGELPLEAQIAVFGVIAFSAGDAYLQASRSKERAEGYRCPHCGHELEEGLALDFCHWCTEPLPRAEEADGEARTEAESPTSR
jgi:hypothetical protein